MTCDPWSRDSMTSFSTNQTCRQNGVIKKWFHCHVHGRSGIGQIQYIDVCIPWNGRRRWLRSQRLCCKHSLDRQQVQRDPAFIRQYYVRFTGSEERQRTHIHWNERALPKAKLSFCKSLMRSHYVVSQSRGNYSGRKKSTRVSQSQS